MFELNYEASYALHIADMQSRMEQLPSLLGAPDSLDARRHWRMYEFLRPIVREDPEASWLTIGDTGADAHALQRLGAKHIVASCIDDCQIRNLKNRNYIPGVSVRSINAEAIPDMEPRPDYVLCKEAYHHFPRPDIALYEFLRTARKAVILIEPVDLGDSRLLDVGKRLAKKVIRGDSQSHFVFEETGNFIFRLSMRELDKKLTSIQNRTYYFRLFNDFFCWPLCRHRSDHRLAALTQGLGVAVQDVACRLGLMAWGLAAVAIPTQSFHVRLGPELELSGFTKRSLPRNPFACLAPVTRSSECQRLR